MTEPRNLEQELVEARQTIESLRKTLEEIAFSYRNVARLLARDALKTHFGEKKSLQPPEPEE